MNRYKQQDAQKELEQKAFSAGGDETGGISKIFAASVTHTQPEDDQYLRRLLDHYSVGGKGEDGMPNGERVLNKYGMKLAADEVLEEWVGLGQISQPAIDLFLQQNLDKVWQNYDGFNKDSVPASQAIFLVRELMQQAPNPDAGKKDPQEIEGSQSNNVFDKQDSDEEKPPQDTKEKTQKEVEETDKKEDEEADTKLKPLPKVVPKESAKDLKKETKKPEVPEAKPLPAKPEQKPVEKPKQSETKPQE